MARSNFLQSSFLGGEISTLAQGNSLAEEYAVSAAVLLNYIPSDEGAAMRRSGTRLSGFARAAPARLLEFVSETEDALIAEITTGFLRFHARGKNVTDQAPKLVLSVSSATPAVVTTDTAHGYTTGDFVVFREFGDSAAAPLRNAVYQITVLDADEFSLAHAGPLSGSVNGATLVLPPVVEVDRITERAVPYTAAQLRGIKYSEEGSTLYLFHPEHEITTLDRKSLVVTTQQFSDGPYLDENETATTLAFSGTSGAVTVTASSAAGINDDAGFQATDVGRAIRVNTGTADAPVWRWLRITARASAVSVTATVQGLALSSAVANTKWRLGAFSDTTGWPTHGAVHEGRLFLVSAAYPGRIDASRTFDFFNFSPTAPDGTVADDNSVTGVFAGAGRQNGRWVQPVESGLLLGTDGGEYLVRASSFDDPISPFSLQVRRYTDYGSADAMPRRTGRNTVFIQSVARALMEYRTFEGDSRTGFDGNDLARAARHLTTEGLVELAQSRVPLPIMWCLRSDGRVVGVTYRDDAQGRTVAWHRYSFAWKDDVAAGEDAADRYLRGGTSRSDGGIVSIAAAPFSSPEATRDDILWMAIDRNGVLCVEYMTPVFDVSYLPSEAFYGDSGVMYRQEDLGLTWEENADGTITLYGLDHLNDCSVDVVFRSADLGSFTVTGGAVTAPVAPELDQASAADQTSQVTQAIGGTVSFASGFISQRQAPLRDRAFNAQAAFLRGPTGNLYYLAREENAVSFGIYAVDAADGVLAASRISADIASDAAADGVVPPSGWPGGPPAGGSPAGGEWCFSLPEQPYIFATLGSHFAVSVSHGLAYYTFTAGETFTYLGGVAEDPTGPPFLGFPDRTENPEPVIKTIGAYCVNETGDFFRKSFLLMAGGANGLSVIFSWPSVEEVEGTSPINLSGPNNIEGRGLILTTLAPAFDGIFRSTEGTEVTITGNQGFFLPGRGSMLLFSYVNKELMTQHAAGTAVVTVPALTAQSLLSTDPVLVQFRIFARTYDDMHLLSATVDASDKFDGFPFPDIGENFAGTAGTSPINDYGNPSVFPSDPADAMKPWFLFFPRRYPDGADNGDKIGCRAYMWDPKAERATFLSFAKGKLYDIVTDGLPAAQGFSRGVSFYWNRSDNSLLVMSYGATGVGSITTVVSRFGTFVPSTGTITVIDEANVDAVVGLNTQARLQLLRPDVGSGAATGPALGKTRRVDQAAVLLSRTGRMWNGTTFDTTDANNRPLELVFREPDTLGRRPLFSGVFHFRLPSTYDFDNMLTFEQRRPAPGAIVAVNGFSRAEDRQ